ncbi:enoyl-CoA hydratase/isomerase family protein [Glycomyces sp. TRM65418]|uniref:enoyl-CoA hydratase-related protein n=1 Tax=Glycomyces sp. TRM65418 TaxID=2867006 RepID=UPI001CE6652B|nr:enoyl-CoA hydratase-related protein [Glycomyces sp. TRM65418]MCC3765811.1 enoyl-CoA hydratase/isomerase family protein [Glycomyces sp. TRM65418]QZD55397.1 enoyl-CoA hydratase/isomerase family protein [Glycomyces sp. TRM65418]
MTGNDALIGYEAVTSGVATMTLDDRRHRNALSTRLIAESREALANAVADPEVRVIVIDHTGPVFCAGGDLKESAAAARPEDLPAVHLAELLAELCEAPKPVVAVARGGAKGGGMGLLAAADLVIAEHDAPLAFSEVRLGVVPAVIGPVVARKLSPGLMRRLFLTGESFDAARAEGWGLVTTAAEPGSVDHHLEQAVKQLLAGGPSAQAGIKKLTAATDLREELRAAAALTAEYFLSEEGGEGIRSFIEKRPPSWVG